MAVQSQNSTKKERDRIGMILYYLYAAFLILSVILVGRIAWIQWLWKPDKTIERYFRPVSVKTIIDPERGAIIGQDGKLLAMSTPMYELFMDCTVRKDYFESKGREGKKLEAEWQSKAKQFAKGLSAEMGGDGENYWKLIEKGRKDGNKYLRLGHPVDRETLIRLRRLPLMDEGQYKSGVIVVKKDSRQYPYGTLARRTIGYVKDNSNSNGNNHIGLEGKYDYVLHGKEGEMWTRPTDNRERIQNYDSLYVKPEDGLDVRTTLDITMQDIVDRALRRQIEDNKAIEMGCAVIMDVKTGAIRSMVNLMRDSTDWSLSETYNMAIGLNSEPGSVFKATTLMTALEDGYIQSLDDRIPTNNGILPGYPPDDHVRGMKDISILHGFEISSNYVFRYLKETPLHILTFYNAIANKGKMMKPYLVESIEKDGVVKTKKGPSVLNASICSRATADTLLRAMKAVTSEGTATRLKGARVQVAGKTGTSRQVLSGEEIKKFGMQNPYVTKDGSYHNLATFVGFFPADSPKYSAIICLKSYLIRGSVYGGVLPAAAMREIVDALYALEPDWGHEIESKVSVPQMALDREMPVQADAKNPVVPDVKGLGLKDAMYMIENSGLRCIYSGTGHVSSQIPQAGQKASKESTVTISLK